MCSVNILLKGADKVWFFVPVSENMKFEAYLRFVYNYFLIIIIIFKTLIAFFLRGQFQSEYSKCAEALRHKDFFLDHFTVME